MSPNPDLTDNMKKSIFHLCIIAVATGAQACFAGTPPPGCQPSVTTNSVGSPCPDITSNGAINANSFCFNQGSAPPMPQLTSQPTASTGSAITTITTTAADCSTSSTSSTNAITYSFSGLQFTNSAPPTANSPPGVYTSDCYVTVTSSDTNDCPASPSIIDYGNVTWTVNSITGCMPTAPPSGGTVGLPSVSPFYYDTGPYFAGWGITEDDIYSGAINNITGTDNYVASGGIVLSGCGQPLNQSFTGTSWTFTGTFVSGGVTLKLQITGPQQSSVVFALPATPNVRWYGQVYNEMITPGSGTLVGNEKITMTYPNNQTVMNYPVNQTINMGGTPYLNSVVGASCQVICCP